MGFFIPEAVAQSASAPPQGGSFVSLIMIAILFVVMYFMIIRPQRKRQKEHQSLVESLGKGDEVVLNSGMVGKITDVDEHYITVDATVDGGNNKIQLRFQKLAVHAVLPKGTLKKL